MKFFIDQISMLRFAFAALAFLFLPITPAAAQEKPSVSFAVIGDTGTGDEAQLAVANQMVKQRIKSPFDFVLMLGDNIYERGEERKIKTHFEDPYKDLIAAGVKFYAVLGNHDIIRGLEFQTHYPNFNMGGKRYYRFTRTAKGTNDLIEFFALDTNLMTGEQLNWLEAQLKASKARWKIVFCHHSIYSSSRMHPPYIELREQLQPLYVKYGVNAVFSGHSHCYERTKPQMGVQYFTAGSSGEIKRGTLNPKSPLTAVGNDRVNIFLVITATDTEMKVDAIAADGAQVDSYVIKASGGQQ